MTISLNLVGQETVTGLRENGSIFIPLLLDFHAIFSIDESTTAP
jgi:hypothetical protein